MPELTETLDLESFEELWMFCHGSRVLARSDLYAYLPRATISRVAHLIGCGFPPIVYLESVSSNTLLWPL